MQDSERIKNAKLLISRLERISADSIMAHKVSGIRGSILRIVDSQVEFLSPCDRHKLDELIFLAYDFLEQVCLEMMS